MRRETTEIPAYKISYSQKPTFWSSPSESRQQWLECRHLKSILAESWYSLRGMSLSNSDVKERWERLTFGGQTVQSYKIQVISLWLYCYNSLCSLLARKGRNYCFFRNEEITFPTCADVEISVILVTHLILSRGHSVPLAHPSAEIASGWSDYRLCLAHFGPKASGHFQFPPGDSHLQI